MDKGHPSFATLIGEPLPLNGTGAVSDIATTDAAPLPTFLINYN